MKKYLTKLWRSLLVILMITSNFSGFGAITAHAAVQWWGNGPQAPRGESALGMLYPAADTGNINLSLGSYSTGGKTLGSGATTADTWYTFCIEMGTQVDMNNRPSTETTDDALGAFMMDYYINRQTPDKATWSTLTEDVQNNYKLTHAAMGMYFRDNYEVALTKGTYQDAKERVSQTNSWENIEKRLGEMKNFARENMGPYNGVVNVNPAADRASATVDFEILSAANNNVKSLFPFDVTLTATNGVFQNGQSTLTFKSNTPPSEITVKPNATGDVKVDMKAVGLPGTKLTQYHYPSGAQDFIAALETNRQTMTATASEKLIKPFKIDATTETPLRLKKGETLKDEIQVKVIQDTTWSNLLDSTEKVPANLKVDWYYSENDYGTTKIPVDQLDQYQDIQYLGSDDLVADDGAKPYTLTSQLTATKYGFYYPVVSFDVSAQGDNELYFTKDSSFHKPFNDDNEQTLVKWQPKVKTTNLILNDNEGEFVEGYRLPIEGGKVRDRLEVWDNKPGYEITVKSKLYGPFLTKPDFINNPNQHEGGKEVDIPGNLKPYAEVETKITGNTGDNPVDTPEITIKGEDKGWYVWVETIEDTDYTESWQSHFGSENEYALVPWEANIETKVSTTSAVVGKQIHDRITVGDIPGMWGLLGDGKGNLNDWDNHAELKGKDRDPLKDGSYNMPEGWGESAEDKDLIANFTMYYSPVKPEQGTVPENAIVFDEITAPLIYGELNTKEFKKFDKPGYYTIVVTGGSDTGRVAKFETPYGLPSETVHVVTNDEYFTKVNDEKVHIGDKVWDTLKVTKAPINFNAEASFTLYKYSDEVDDFDFSNPEKVAETSKVMKITKAGEYKSNAKGFGLEELTLDAPGTYGWVAKVVDKTNDEVLYEGVHGEAGEVFTVADVDIKTNAVDRDTEMDEGLADEEVIITDTVSYTGLVPDKEYTLSGVLMDKATNKPFMVGKNKVTATKKFTPTKAEGTETLEFKITKGDLAGKTVVVFENLEYNNREIAVHANIDDEDQTVSYPKVGTKAAQISGVDEEVVTIHDQVAYENLKLGKEYTVKGVLMNKATKAPFTVKNAAGKETVVTGEATIPANHSGSGTIEVAFTFPRSVLTEDLELVVFEELFNIEGKLVGEHKDIEDKDQTVNQPGIKTNATDKETGSKQGLATDDVTIVDEVSYRNLIVGNTYTVKGVLMDKETNKPFLTKENKEVYAEKEFVAKKETVRSN